MRDDDTRCGICLDTGFDVLGRRCRVCRPETDAELDRLAFMRSVLSDLHELPTIRQHPTACARVARLLGFESELVDELVIPVDPTFGPVRTLHRAAAPKLTAFLEDDDPTPASLSIETIDFDLAGVDGAGTLIYRRRGPAVT